MNADVANPREDELDGPPLGSDAIGSDAIGSDAIGSDAIGSDAIGAAAIGAAAPGATEGAGSSARLARLRSLAITGFKLALAGGLFAYIFTRPEFSKAQLGERLAQAATSPSLLWVLLLAFVAISMSGLRWQILLRGEGIRVPLLTVLRLTWIGHFWNMVIPGAVSGDAIKAYFIGIAAPERREEAWTTVLADRVIGLVALVSVSTLAALLNLGFVWERAPLRAVFVTMLVLLCAALAASAFLALGVGRRWRVVQRLVAALPLTELMTRGYRSLHRLGRNPRGLAAAYLISFVAHGIAVVNAFLLGRAAGEAALSFMQYCLVIPITLFSNALPITPGGLGVGESVLGKLFEWSGGSDEDGLTVMLLFRAVFYALALLGAVLYVLYRHPAPARPGRPEPAPPA